MARRYDERIFMAEHGAMYPDFIRINHEWWRIITAGFLHFGAVHLVNNMVILYCMGSRLERVTGHLKYFLIYLVSLIGAGLLSYGMMLRTSDYQCRQELQVLFSE